MIYKSVGDSFDPNPSLHALFVRKLNEDVAGVKALACLMRTSAGRRVHDFVDGMTAVSRLEPSIQDLVVLHHVNRFMVFHGSPDEVFSKLNQVADRPQTKKVLVGRTRKILKGLVYCHKQAEKIMEANAGKVQPPHILAGNKFVALGMPPSDRNGMAVWLESVRLVTGWAVHESIVRTATEHFQRECVTDKIIEAAWRTIHVEEVHEA